MWIDPIASMVVAGSTIWGAVIATKGLGLWREQLRGTSEYDASRRFLRAAFQVRESVRHVRNAWLSDAEMEAAVAELKIQRAPGQLDTEWSRRRQEAAYMVRWRSVATAMQTLEAEAIEAEVLWGTESRSSLSQLRKCVSRLYAAMVMHFQLDVKDRTHEPRTEESKKLAESVFNDLYDQGSFEQRDAFGGDIDRAVSAIEAHLLPHLRASR